IVIDDPFGLGVPAYFSADSECYVSQMGRCGRAVSDLNIGNGPATGLHAFQEVQNMRKMLIGALASDVFGSSLPKRALFCTAPPATFFLELGQVGWCRRFFLEHHFRYNLVS